MSETNCPQCGRPTFDHSDVCRWEAAKAEAMLAHPDTACVHGKGPACPECLGIAKHLDLVHAIATCTHDDTLTFNVLAGDRLEWCARCGARRRKRSDPTRWHLPDVGREAKALDGGAASSGPPSGASDTDSSPKKSS